DEPLTEININGQTFDLGGAAAVLETIPEEILKNLKVYDKTSDMEKFSGRRSRRGNRNMVLDLTTRDEFGSMLVAKARVAQGTERKLEYAADVNRIKKQGDNINLLAQTGNLRSRSAYHDNRNDRLNAGFNIQPKDKLRVAARAGYNHSIDGSQSSSGSERFLVSGTRWSYSNSESVRKSHGFNASANLSGEITPSMFLQFRTSYDDSDSGSGSGSRQASFKGDPDLDFRDPFGSEQYDEIDKSIRLNEIKQQSTSDSDTRRVSTSASLMKMFNEKKTGLTLSAGYNYNKGVTESFSLSRTTYYELRDIFGNDSVLLRNQYRRSPSRTNSYNASLGFSQRFSESVNLDFTYTINSSRSRSYRDTYDLSPFFSPDMEMPASWLPDGFEAGYTDSLSNHSLSNTLTHGFKLTFNYYTDFVSLLANFQVLPERRTLDQKTGKVYADTVRHSVNFAPDLTFSLRPGKSHIDLKYRGETQQPSLSDLLTLTDNSDPLNISHGNPNLSPSYQQNIEATFDNREIGLNLSSRWSNTYNSVTQNTTYDLATGGVETYPVNINGNWNSRNSLRYTLRLRKIFRITSDNSAGFTRRVGLLNEGRQPQASRSVTNSRNLSSRLRFSYSPSWGSMEVSGSWGQNFSKNLLRGTRNYERSYRFGYNIFANIPGNVQLKSDISYSFRNGTNINPGEDDQLLWNLEASWRFLRKRQAEIKIEWRDILSNSKDFRRSVSADGVNESYSRVIGSYFLATFRYNLNIFNGKGEMPRFMRDRGNRRDRGD
ncbi:MAG: outer membrane beta-barrel family protein, partial [Duncaniella sp.]|nr:outer membrane beta-barrel family protein [Duncaniella sp.]